MTTYCIGDVQGCYCELRSLLNIIKFDKDKDTLWFVGDLVNRGPNSLEVLRFIKNLPRKIVVLGNHDLHLIMLYYKATNFSSVSLDQVIEAPDSGELIEWLKNQRLFYYDAESQYCMMHAGLPPQWNLATAKKLAKEAEEALQGPNFKNFLVTMYGNEPNKWSEDLTGNDRLRFIINAFTRIRFCTNDGVLNFTCDTKIGSQPKNYYPWFKIQSRHSKDLKILFGHWAALMGKVYEPNIYALDTGCVWGGALTAMRIDTQEKSSVPCLCP